MKIKIFLNVINNKEIHSLFPLLMKRKTVLSIKNDGYLKVKRNTIVVTNQFHEKSKKEEDKTIKVFVGSKGKI